MQKPRPLAKETDSPFFLVSHCGWDRSSTLRCPVFLSCEDPLFSWTFFFCGLLFSDAQLQLDWSYRNIQNIHTLDIYAIIHAADEALIPGDNADDRPGDIRINEGDIILVSGITWH
ncbi:hypothetical protein Q8A67_025474 [Cirrhinus molitorella]|uniref:Uncharacterized protein n=1 Tax=Cirrhinus molitorella TaxID=172907 RepID=A0AA88T8A8_9TELE|nr:hypothetical protein Q8A67_025474 [Cirrhinus molitorella]